MDVTGMTGPKGVAVHDVWRPHEDVGGQHSVGFDTDAFGGHDSRFYILTPYEPPSPKPAAAPAPVAPDRTCEESCLLGPTWVSDTPAAALGHCCIGEPSPTANPSRHPSYKYSTPSC